MKNMIKKSELKILVISNNDFNEEQPEDTDVPPLPSSLFYASRSSISQVAHSVQKALIHQGFLVVDHVGIKTREELKHVLSNSDHHLIFNLCESLEGQDHLEVFVVEELERYKRPFTGNNSQSLALAQNKFLCHKLLQKKRVSTPQSYVFNNIEEVSSFLFESKKYIVKPNEQDGSEGIEFSSVVSNKKELYYQVNSFLEKQEGNVIVQEYIEGREINLIFIRNPSGIFWNFTEILFENFEAHIPKILNYSSKWNPSSIEYRNTITTKALISDSLKKEMIKMAKKTLEALNLTSYGRIDFRVDAKGRPFVIDVNPNCDLDPNAGFSKAASYKNLSYPQLIENLIYNALHSFGIFIFNDMGGTPFLLEGFLKEKETLFEQPILKTGNYIYGTSQSFS